MLSRFRASVVDVAVRVAEVAVVGRVAVRWAVVDEVGRVVDVVEEVNLPTGLLVEVVVREEAVVEAAGFLSAAEPMTLDLRSAVDVDLSGARVGAVPAIDMRLAVPEIPRFSSPELATDRGFSSAELLTDGRDRWDEVVEVLKGFLVADVVVGRVGGLFNVLLKLVLVDVAPVFAIVEDEVGRLAAVIPATDRLELAEALVLVLAGDTGVFSLDASGLDLPISSPPESTEDSIGVAGGDCSTSASDEMGIGSSVDDIWVVLGV